MVLSEYKNIVGTAASVTTIAQQFAPAFMCLDIIRKGTTSNVDSTPFIGGLVMCCLMLQHGLLLEDSAMITVNVFGLFLNTIYFTLYYTYTENKASLLAKCSKAVIFVAILLGYVRVESFDKVEFNFGIILTIMMLLLIGSPLFSLKEIIETGDTSKLPIPLILSGTVVTFLWLLYGIIIENIFIQVQNVIAFILCIVQLCLIVIYPPNASAANVQKENGSADNKKD